MRLAFTILGAPRSKKNSSRVVYVGKPCPACRRGPFPKIKPSAAHEEWFSLALPQAEDVRRIAMPYTIAVPVNVAATVYRERADGDLLNYLAALSDLLQAACIVENDVLCVAWDGSRLAKDAENPRIEVVITDVPRPAKVAKKPRQLKLVK